MAKYVLNDYSTTSSVTEMLNTLNWQTLESRRIKSSLILLYKSKYQLVAIDHFYLTETKDLIFFVPYFRTKYHMNSFSLEQSDTGTVSRTASRPAPAYVNFLLGWSLSHFSHLSFYVFNCRKCRVFNFIIINDHICLNKHPFSSFSSFFPDSASQ